MNRTRTKPRHHRAALGAAAPPVLMRAWHEPVSDRVWVIALGKAAAPMARAAVRVLAERGHAPAGGLVVSAEPTEPPHPAIAAIAGDHPEPGARSLAAAAALDGLIERIPAGDTVWVLLSGGTTVRRRTATRILRDPRRLGAAASIGLDIAMNLRGNASRGGRPACAEPAHVGAVHCYIVSMSSRRSAAIGSTVRSRPADCV
jgi:hypothetical protein